MEVWVVRSVKARMVLRVLNATLKLLLCIGGACRADPHEACSEGACRDPEQSVIFDQPRVHALGLEIERSAMAELAREPKDWVKATLIVGDRRYNDISIRFKGHRSLRGWAGKPALKLAFDKGKHSARRILGLRGMVLNNMVDDPSMLREQLGARVYEALGVPAPRASFAELVINGERFGLYSLIENIDEDMLARHFGDGTGPHYEGEYGCDLYPADVWGLQLHGGHDEGRAWLRELTQRVGEPPGRSVLGEAPIVERERVLMYLAASTLLGDFDGYRHAHNYRIYRDPGTGRWSFIPWGFDRILKKSFAVFDSRGRVARVCYADPDCRRAYVQTLQAAIVRFEQMELGAVIAGLERVVGPTAARDPRRPHTRAARSKAVKQLLRFVAAQPERLRRQLHCWNGEREVDADGDGFGCMDCDDASAAIHPGAQERCDGLDNDCSGNVDDAASCGCPSVQVGDARFVLCDMPMSYWDAEQFCRSLGSTLAKLDSRAALQALHGRAQTQREGDWWVGLSDQAREGDYVWPDGSRPTRGLWARGEPDPYSCGQHCVALHGGKRTGLRDQHCATVAPFVCAANELELSLRSFASP